VRAQRDLLRRQLARSSHDVKDDLRLGLAEDDHAIDFACFDGAAGRRNRRRRWRSQLWREVSGSAVAALTVSAQRQLPRND
jgi:hypothetical protein